MRRAFSRRPPLFVLAAVGLWLAFSGVLSVFTGRVAVWYLMTDELLYERLAISIAKGHSPLPRVHGELIPSLNQLYPLVIAPAFTQGSVPAALHDAHVLSAFVMASVIIPVFLLARRVVQSERVALLVAALAVCVPWIVYSSFLLTEVVAYPAFVWALLGLQRATTSPRARNDLLAVGALALAILARTQFTLLLVVLPAAIFLHELALAEGASRRERARGAVRRAVAGHLPLVAACAVLIVVVGGLAAAGRLSDVLGTYSTTVKGDVVPSGIARSFTEHVATLALGLGVLPFVLGVAWLLGGLAARRTREQQQAFAFIGVLTTVVVTLQVTIFDLRFAEGDVIDRYLFYLAPVALIGFGAALADRGWPRWSLLWPTAVVLIGFALMPFRFFETLNVDTPVSALDDGLKSFSGSTGNARALLVAGTAVVVALFVQASLLLRRRSVVTVLVVLTVGASLAQTGNSFSRLFGGDEAAGRPLTGDQGVRLGWIDATLGSDADVTMIPYPRILLAYSKSMEFAWDTEFWNMSVRHTAVDAGGAFNWAPTGTFPTTELRFDERTGRANVTISKHAVSSEREARFRLAGRVLKVVQSAMLIETAQPWRADWISRGLTDDGWTLPNMPASIRIFAVPGQTGPAKRYVTLLVRAPAGVEARPFTVRSNMETWSGEAFAKYTVRNQLQVCVPALGFADVRIGTAENSQTHGDPITGFLYHLTPREVGVGLAQVALADEIFPGCEQDD